MKSIRQFFTFILIFSFLAQPVFADDEYITRLRDKSEKGDAEAQYNLAIIYFTGVLGIKQDCSKGVILITKAAENFANSNKKKKEVIEEDLIADLNSSEASYSCKQEIVKWLEKQSEQGNSFVQFLLAKQYLDGNTFYNTKSIIVQDYKKALNLFQKLAKQNNIEAQYTLGQMYYDGNGVTKDYIEAVKWWEISADKGESLSQDALAEAYYNGKGVEKNYILAYKWFNIFKANNSESLNKTLNINGYLEALEKQMTPEEIAEAQKLSREWKPSK